MVDIAAVSGLETTHRLRLAELMSLDFELRYQLCAHLKFCAHTIDYFGEALPMTLLENYNYTFQETARQLSIRPITADCELQMRRDYPSESDLYVECSAGLHHPLSSSFPHVALVGGCGHYTTQLARHDKVLLEGNSKLNLLVTAALCDRLDPLKTLLEMGAPLDAQITFTAAFEEEAHPKLRPVWMVIISYLAMEMVARYLDGRPIDDLTFEMLEAILRYKSLPECAILVGLPNANVSDLDPKYFITLEQIIQAASPPNKDKLLSYMTHWSSTIKTALNYLNSLSIYPRTKRVTHLPFDGVMRFDREMHPLDIIRRMQIAEIACGDWIMPGDLKIGLC
jgi:hypothetical protein